MSEKDMDIIEFAEKYLVIKLTEEQKIFLKGLSKGEGIKYILDSRRRVTTPYFLPELF
jgi:hypothetical protein